MTSRRRIQAEYDYSLRQRLRAELDVTLGMINEQMEQVHAVAAQNHCKASEIRSASGDFLMTPLLVARAQLLSTLSMMNAKL